MFSIDGPGSLVSCIVSSVGSCLTVISQDRASGEVEGVSEENLLSDDVDGDSVGDLLLDEVEGISEDSLLPDTQGKRGAACWTPC